MRIKSGLYHHLVTPCDSLTKYMPLAPCALLTPTVPQHQVFPLLGSLNFMFLLIDIHGTPPTHPCSALMSVQGGLPRPSFAMWYPQAPSSHSATVHHLISMTHCLSMCIVGQPSPKWNSLEDILFIGLSLVAIVLS